jgi:hypothetical protein
MYFSPATATGVYGDIHIFTFALFQRNVTPAVKLKKKNVKLQYVFAVLVNLLKEE